MSPESKVQGRLQVAGAPPRSRIETTLKNGIIAGQELGVHFCLFLILLLMFKASELLIYALWGDSGLIWFRGSGHEIHVGWAFDVVHGMLFGVFAVCGTWNFLKAMLGGER